MGLLRMIDRQLFEACMHQAKTIGPAEEYVAYDLPLQIE